MKRKDSIVLASQFFLTKELPQNWEELSTEEVDNFLIDYAWEHFEHCDADYIWENIEVLAVSFEQVSLISFKAGIKQAQGE